VVSKIAGIATRDVDGVHAVGGGTARAVGALRERIPGARTNLSIVEALARGVALSYTPCRYARRWPDLWARLPTDEDCREVSEALAKHSVAGVEPKRQDVEKIRWDVANELSLYQAEPGAMRPFTALVPVLDEMTVTRPVVDADGTAVATETPSVAQLLDYTRGPASGAGRRAPGPAALRPGPRGRADLRPRPRRGPRAVAVPIPPGRCRGPGGRW